MIVTKIFGQLYHQIFGFKETDFIFYRTDGSINYNIPLSNISTVIILTALYYISIFSIQLYMKQRKPINMKPLFALHNSILSILSLLLLVLMLETLVPILYNNGFFYGICSPEMFHGDHGRRLELFYYINYLYKFYELVDTYFMALSKKNLEFLHVYHHSITIWLCYAELIGNTAVQWWVISLNLFVHVIMYYYYARSAMGAQIWWKKYLTTLQIVQFLLDLAIVYYCTATHFLGKYFPEVFPGMDCYGSESAALIGCFILSSYLMLFVQFFFKTYTKKVK